MYPALATVQAMVSHYPDVLLAFVGTVGGFERPLVEQSGVRFDSYDEVQAGPVHGVNVFRLLNSLRKLAVGTLQSYRLLRLRKPQAILATGGWASLPVALMARLRGVPLLIYLPDIEPGLTIKVLRRFSRRVAITVPESARFFAEGQTVVTGYPLRAEMYAATREAALAHFSLDPSKRTLLVFGGSRGARAINIAFGDLLPELLARGDVQVIHVTGELDWPRVQEQVAAVRDHPDYHAHAYLHDDMGLAFAAADLAVCRAGASILGEFPFFELPSILIPLAYAWRYQQVNAEYLAQRQAAIHLDEAAMSTQLLPLIQSLLDDPARLAQMRSKVAALADRDGAANVAHAVIELAQGAK